MTRRTLTTAMAAMALALLQTPAAAQDALFHGTGSHTGPTLHLTNPWKECSFQLDAALTQSAWRQFTQEAALVVYFRPLSDARPMGKGKFEVSILQWQTNIDDHDAAWNDTFVHPDAEHWLFDGSGLKFPGLTVRAGVTNNTDVGVYWTKNPNANYGVAGMQLQRAFLGGETNGWAVSTRASFATLYGPEDVDLNVYGADLVASKAMRLSRWATVSPYALVSTYLSHAHEKSAIVDLKDEQRFGAQATVGAAMLLSKARLSAEYNVAKVPSISMKIGFGM